MSKMTELEVARIELLLQKVTDIKEELDFACSPVLVEFWRIGAYNNIKSAEYCLTRLLEEAKVVDNG